MVDCQIHTSGVVSPAVLQSFQTVPREEFVPESLRGISYNDDDLPLGEGRYMPDPTVHARMLQAIEPKMGEVALDIGCLFGYSSAVLSGLVTTVIALEQKQKYIDKASEIWGRLDVLNVVGLKGRLDNGAPEHAPYDLIILNGAVPEIPVNLTAQLSPQGRLICIVKEPGKTMGTVQIARMNSRSGFSSYSLFDAGGHYLPGFEPETSFKF